MALEEYRRKRDFQKTSEPAPRAIGKSGAKLAYLIQKHDATRLHYDFRLEYDGVLLSWAVTKGPSLHPADKRLAVRTEDHPLSYGTFEGTIPEGQYGGGTVMLWDEGTWEPKGDPEAGLKKGHLSFFLKGSRLKGGWDLIRMRGTGKRENWLLIKEKDDEARTDPGDADFLDSLSFSVKSGRSMDAIAGGESQIKASRGELNLGAVRITHPDRVISETGHITKGELAEYHEAIAPFLLPGISRRPLSLLRCPSGIDHPCFYQRNPGKGLGPNVHPFEFRNKGKTYEYLYVEDKKGLLALIQMGAIEIHPWGASIDAIDTPDRMIFDLDPAPELPFEVLKVAARDLRKRLRAKGLEPLLKCTGGKGLHMTVPLARRNSWAEVKAFAASIAEEMAAAAPEAYVATMSKAKRAGKIFIDFFRNDYTATAIADYSVRARPGAPVAVPLDWNELKRLKSASQFSMKDALKRIQKQKPEAQAEGQILPASQDARPKRKVSHG